MMTCENMGAMSVLGNCSLAWFSFAIVLMLCLIMKRQVADGFLAGTNFNFPFALIIGLAANVILTTITGDAMWSLLAGLAGLAVGGFGVGMIWDTSEGSEDYG
jgi:hypothetical protein